MYVGTTNIAVEEFVFTSLDQCHLPSGTAATYVYTEASRWRETCASRLQWLGYPIVVVHKKDGGIRICGDFKVSVQSQAFPCQHLQRYLVH